MRNSEAKKKLKLRLLAKFIISLVVVGALLTVLISVVSYVTNKNKMEEIYAERVRTNANAIAAMLDPADVETLLAPGGGESETYTRMYNLFNQLKRDGEVTYLSLTVPDEDSVCFYIDALVEEMGDDPANQLPWGSDILYTDAANPDDPKDMEKYITIWEQFEKGKGLEEPIVTDNDYGYNYTGIAVVLDEAGNAIAEVQYILDMTQVRAYLLGNLTSMLLLSLIFIAVIMVGYVIFIRTVLIKPISDLADFTKTITETCEFENHRVPVRDTGDEIQSLGESFNFMMATITDYIANLSKVTAEKERIGAELDIATGIQKSMLPCIFPAFPDRQEFDIHATMDPAKEVGGDFYDFFMVDDRHLAMVVADVSGKGVPAALFMVIGKTLIKDHTNPDEGLGNVFTEVNNILCDSNSEGLFITAFEAVLDLVTGELRYVNAGHEMPFIKRKDGRFEAMKVRPGFVLAGMEDMRYKPASIMLEEGDKFFQYTDGVTEATNAYQELFGMERLDEALNYNNEGTPAQICSAVKHRIDRFVGSAPQFDDITMLCMEFKKRMEEQQ